MDSSDAAAALAAEYNSLYVGFTVSESRLINLTWLSSSLSNYCSNAAAGMLSDLRYCP